MLMKILVPCLLLATQAASAPQGDANAMIRVPGGSYVSFVPERKKPGAPLQAPTLTIASFAIDQHPVTNEEFLAFVQQNPTWRRDQVNRLFVDARYLVHWPQALGFGEAKLAKSPVVNVSWFAARAYCQAFGKRLPSTNEWEYVAGVDHYGSSPQDKEKYLQKILEWYAQPAPLSLASVGSSSSHRLGIQDLHGLIWEWTSDFNSIIASQEAREDSSPDAAMFCGAGSLGGKDPSDYASYMRFAFRSSLKGGFSLGHLGFRCARDLSSD